MFDKIKKSAEENKISIIIDETKKEISDRRKILMMKSQGGNIFNVSLYYNGIEFEFNTLWDNGVFIPQECQSMKKLLHTLDTDLSYPIKLIRWLGYKNFSINLY